MFVDFDPVATGKLLTVDYIQHNPSVPTGAAAIIGYFAHPDGKWHQANHLSHPF